MRQLHVVAAQRGDETAHETALTGARRAVQDNALGGPHELCSRARRRRCICQYHWRVDMKAVRAVQAEARHAQTVPHLSVVSGEGGGDSSGEGVQASREVSLHTISQPRPT